MEDRKTRYDILNRKFLEECFIANFNTGTLIWRSRPRKHFATNNAYSNWNSKYPGTIASHTSDNNGVKRSRVSIGGHKFLSYHILWTMFYDEVVNTTLFNIDHINRNSNDNRITNLRKVLPFQNQYNRSHELVSYDRFRKKWKVNFKQEDIHVVGRLDSKELGELMVNFLSFHLRGDYSPFKEFKYSSITTGLFKGVEKALKKKFLNAICGIKDTTGFIDDVILHA